VGQQKLGFCKAHGGSFVISVTNEPLAETVACLFKGYVMDLDLQGFTNHGSQFASMHTCLPYPNMGNITCSCIKNNSVVL